MNIVVIIVFIIIMFLFIGTGGNSNVPIIIHGEEVNYKEEREYERKVSNMKYKLLLNNVEYTNLRDKIVKRFDEHIDSISEDTKYETLTKKVKKENVSYEYVIKEELKIYNYKHNKKISVLFKKDMTCKEEYVYDNIRGIIYINTKMIKSNYGESNLPYKTIEIFNIAYSKIIDPNYKFNDYVQKEYMKYIEDKYYTETITIQTITSAFNGNMKQRYERQKIHVMSISDKYNFVDTKILESLSILEEYKSLKKLQEEILTEEVVKEFEDKAFNEIMLARKVE